MGRKKDYKHLKLDKLGDKGKLKYAEGKTITGNKNATAVLSTVGGLTISGAAYAKKMGLIDDRTALAVARTGAAVIGATYVKKANDWRVDRQLRAYYRHTSNY